MVIFLTTTLILSSIAMCVLLYVKHWELETGHVLMQDIRPRVGGYFHGLVYTVETHLPNLLRMRLIQAKEWGRVYLRAALARLIIAIEHTLERTLHTLREKTSTKHEVGEASAFLREVAEHKKKLMRRRRPEAIRPPEL